MDASCVDLRASCVDLCVSYGKVRVACGKSLRFLQQLLWEHSFHCGFFGCAERSWRALEPILWYHGKFRVNDDPQSGAARDEVVELGAVIRASATFAQAVFSSGTAQDGK